MASTIRNLAAFLLAAQALMAFMSQSSAYDFYVGGKDGWGQQSPETYNNWAARNRFQVNDKLVFRYNKGEDSVLLVKKEDYDACNTSNPIRRLDDGNSVFQFDRSGHFFFVSGVHERCAKGEKMGVAVMAARHAAKRPTPPPLHLPLPPSLSPSAAHSPSVLLSPSSGGASAPAPAPAPSSGDNSASSSPCGLRVGSVGLVAIVFMSFYVFHI